jgi:hypothetical protein
VLWHMLDCLTDDEWLVVLLVCSLTPAVDETDGLDRAS